MSGNVPLGMGYEKYCFHMGIQSSWQGGLTGASSQYLNSYIIIFKVSSANKVLW